MMLCSTTNDDERAYDSVINIGHVEASNMDIFHDMKKLGLRMS